MDVLGGGQGSQQCGTEQRAAERVDVAGRVLVQCRCNWQSVAIATVVAFAFAVALAVAPAIAVAAAVAVAPAIAAVAAVALADSIEAAVGFAVAGIGTQSCIGTAVDVDIAGIGGVAIAERSRLDMVDTGSIDVVDTGSIDIAGIECFGFDHDIEGAAECNAPGGFDTGADIDTYGFGTADIGSVEAADTGNVDIADTDSIDIVDTGSIDIVYTASVDTSIAGKDIGGIRIDMADGTASVPVESSEIADGRIGAELAHGTSNRQAAKPEQGAVEQHENLVECAGQHASRPCILERL